MPQASHTVPVVVPPYCRSRAGRVYRIHRFSEELGPGRMRYTLRASPLGKAAAESKEASREINTAQLADRLRNRQVVPTPEETYEQIWQQLRLDVDAVEGPAAEESG